MSRVFSAMTGTGPGVISPPVAALPDDGVWENSPEEVPFIEIGGPEGPISSVTTTTATDTVPSPSAPATSAPRTAATQRSFPRLAEPPHPLYLSVRFHHWPTTHPSRPPRPGEPDASLVTFHAPEHPISTEYKDVWHAIIQQHSDNQSHVLYFVSPAAESGTTTVILNLAIQAVRQSQHRVLVLDAHLERPAAAGRLGLPAAPGLKEVMGEQCPLAIALQPACIERLHLLAAGQAPLPSPEQLGRTLPLLLARLRQWYDWILVDTGVWNELPQRDATCGAADALYVVARDVDIPGTAVGELRVQVRRLGGLPRGAIATRLA